MPTKFKLRSPSEDYAATINLSGLSALSIIWQLQSLYFLQAVLPTSNSTEFIQIYRFVKQNGGVYFNTTHL
jgi:hypothetical protein